MKFIKEFNQFNPVINKKATDWVNDNKYLLTHLWNDDLSEDENIEFMVDYFTKYPDEMNRYIKMKKVSQEIPNSLLTNVPKFQNIGSTTDFKSF